MSKKLLLLVFIFLAILAYLDYRTVHGEATSRQSFTIAEKWRIPKEFFNNNCDNSEYQRRILFVEYEILRKGLAHD